VERDGDGANTMISNHKLTAVLKSRTITRTQTQDQKFIMAFDDGSTMMVHTAGSSTSAAKGGTIAKVR
jgi:hypothetical protein